MTNGRRTYLERVGTVVLGIGLAGCAGDDGSDSDPTPTNGQSTTTSDGSREATSEGGDGDGGADDGTPTTDRTPSVDPAATDLPGTVGEESDSDLGFVRHKHYEQNAVQGVTGVVENAGDRTYTDVTIHAEVTDADGNTAGPFAASMSDGGPDELGPGETWRFKFRFGDEAPDDPESYVVWATGEAEGGAGDDATETAQTNATETAQTDATETDA